MTIIEIISAQKSGRLTNVEPYAEDITAYSQAYIEYKQAKEAYCVLSGISARDNKALATRPNEHVDEWDYMMQKLYTMTDLAEKQYDTTGDITPKAGDIVKHYKGNMYVITSTNTYHTETEERLITYNPIRGEEDLREWARPFSMFSDTVEVDGETIPRFTIL